MDTVFTQRIPIERIAAGVTGVSIAVCLLIGQSSSIIAKDIIGITGLTPTLNFIKDNSVEQELMFETKINSKYKSSKIVTVDKGIKHVKMIRFYNNKPVRINIVEVSQAVNDELVIEPAIASNTLASRSKISNIANRENAIVAINGGYFKPQTGVPLGTLMINKKIYTGPIYDRVAMGIFDDGFDMARVQLKANVNTDKGGVKIDNINQPRMLSTHTIVYTPEWGEFSPPSPKYGTQIIVSNGRITRIGSESARIPQNGFVIVGPISKLEKIYNAKKINFDAKINPEWNDVNHIISGGPYLVKNNEIYVDMTAQKLGSIGGRNPRTAIGYTKDNHLIMLTADGREGSSIGLTLFELANLMKEFGCVNAMNLDGGGSTVMLIKGQVVNKPAVQGGIPLSHTLTIRKLS